MGNLWYVSFVSVRLFFKLKKKRKKKKPRLREAKGAVQHHRAQRGGTRPIRAGCLSDSRITLVIPTSSALSSIPKAATATCQEWMGVQSWSLKRTWTFCPVHPPETSQALWVNSSCHFLHTSFLSHCSLKAAPMPYTEKRPPFHLLRTGFRTSGRC